jgi:cellobiose-specific phosphotransferase system component IIA
MPSDYIPKVPVLNKNRVQKIAKKLIEEAGEDRRLALEAHRFFRQMVDENPNDGTAKSLMVDALKVAQSSKNNVVKILNLVVKMEEATSEDKTKASGKGQSNTIFSQFDKLLDE